MTTKQTAAVQKIAELKQGSKEPLSYSQIAAMMGPGFSKDMVQKLGRRHVMTNRPPHLELPKALELSGDYVVIGDVHAQAADWDLVELVANAGYSFGIKKLAIVGDLFNFSDFSKYAPSPYDTPFAGEFIAVRTTLMFLFEQFDEVCWCMGNHDKRFLDFNKGLLSLDNVADMTLPVKECGDARKKITTSMLNFMWLQSGSEKWMLTHSYEYSRAKLSVAQKLSAIHHASVINHHQHHAAMGKDSSGRYWLVDNGCIADPEKLWYSSGQINSMPRMNRGFCVVRDGSCIPFMV